MNPLSNQVVRPISQNADTDWQILVEIELPLDVNARPTLDAWVLNALIPLNLHVDFLNKIRKLAEEVTARAMQTEMVMRSQRTRVLILIPANRPSDVQTWGFFRIEKVELAAENKNSPQHTIEFYLFPEDSSSLTGQIPRQ
jgi:hypothetical protein